MIWPDWKIREWAESGGVEPFDPDCINPASIDLKISHKIRYPNKLRNVWGDIKTVDDIVFAKGDFLLCSTVEFIKMPVDAIGMLFLKSTWGRKGIEHLHAGYVDPGFHGDLTLELQNIWPGEIRIKSGTCVLQLVLCQLLVDCKKDYSKTGHYQNQRGPTPQWR